MKRVLLCGFLCLCFVMSFVCVDVHAVGIAGVNAKAYVLIDAQTGTVIAAKNENQMLPMASTTKIMTTMLLLESGDLDTEFVVDDTAIKIEGSSMGLKEGDIVTKRALCYGMLLPSGNDAANASAVKIAGDYESFAKLMNSRAAKIGMKNTNFVTPSGLDAPNHYSSAYDMALLTREAFLNDTFREICGTKSAKLSYGNPPYDRWLSNTNKLLTRYPYCIGVKTGFTDEAGRCLVSAAEKDGVTLICVTLNCPDDWNSHITLYDYGFSAAKKTAIPVKPENMCIDVVGGDMNTVSLKLANEPTYTVINGEMPVVTVKTVMPKFMYAPLKCGDNVGTAEYYIGNDLIEKVDIVADNDCTAVVKEHKKSLYNTIIDFIKGLWTK